MFLNINTLKDSNVQGTVCFLLLLRSVRVMMW